MALIDTNDLTFTEVRHLPIVKQFAKRIDLVDTVDSIVGSQMELSPGITVLAMVLDSLSGRSPLYRLKEFFHEQDAELLLGVEIPAERFCDHNLGRVMDKLTKVSQVVKKSTFGVPIGTECQPGCLYRTMKSFNTSQINSRKTAKKGAENPPKPFATIRHPR